MIDPDACPQLERSREEKNSAVFLIAVAGGRLLTLSLDRAVTFVLDTVPMILIFSLALFLVVSFSVSFGTCPSSSRWVYE